MFKRLAIPIILALFFLVNSAYAARPKILKKEDLKSGMPAIGFTVFRGTEPERFEVILGELFERDGMDLITARIHGGPFLDAPLEKIGPIAAMSGSPVYINCHNYDDCDKNGILVGAVSYRPRSFVIAGDNAFITPAQDMGGTKGFKYLSPEFLRQLGIVSLASLSPDLPISSMSGGTISDNCKQLEDKDLKAGSMISVYKMRGDIPMYASGTVTWRDGNNIFAFGHPLTGSGRVSFTFFQSRVVTTIQSLSEPFKISGCSVGNEGTIILDGSREVIGIVGLKTKYVDFKFNLNTGSSVQTLNSQLPLAYSRGSFHILLLGQMWLGHNLGTTFDGVPMHYHIRVKINDQQDLVIDSLTVLNEKKDEKEISIMQVFGAVQKIFEALSASDFKYVPSGVEINFEPIRPINIWSKEKIEVNGRELGASKTTSIKGKLGDKFVVSLTLANQNKNQFKKIDIPIAIPPIGKPKTTSLAITMEGGLIFRNFVQLDKYPYTLDKFIAEINSAIEYKFNKVYVRVVPNKVSDDIMNNKVTSFTWQGIDPALLSREYSTRAREQEVFSLPAIDGLVSLKEEIMVTLEMDAP